MKLFATYVICSIYRKHRVVFGYFIGWICRKTPNQENFLSVLEGFWLIYRDSATSTQEVSLVSNEQAVMQRTVSDVIADFGQKMSKFKLPNNNFTTKLAGLDYVKDYVDLHINMMRVFLEAIPSIRWHQLQVGCISKLSRAY